MTRIAPRNLIPLYADRAWSDAELALQVGVDRTTVFKARRALQATGYIFVTEGRAHYRLDPRRHMTAERTAALEALAARLGVDGVVELMIVLADMTIAAPDETAALLAAVRRLIARL